MMTRDALLGVAAAMLLFAACREGDSLEDPGGGGANPKITASAFTSTSTGGTTSSSGTGGGAGGGGGTAPGGSGGTGGQTTCDLTGQIVVNELLPNPSGTDADNEWLELYNKGAGSVDISGWQVEAGTSSYGVKFTFPSSTTMTSQSYVVVGGQNVGFADHNAASPLAMGNAGSNSDAVRIVNCQGTPIDTVVYGTPNTNDNWDDDSGSTATSLGPTPISGESLARTPNGTDTDQSGSDFTSVGSPTPGAAN